MPDVLASAGGCDCILFQWVQNNQGYYWTEEVNDKLREKLVTAFDTIYGVTK